MHSVLDVTVVIQMLNFLCAYWILSKIFLKPAYDLIMKIDQERSAIKNKARQEYERLAFEREKMMHELTVQQQNLVNAAPVIKKPTVRQYGFTGVQIEEPMSEKDKQKMVKELTERLKKRIIHG